MRFITFVCFCFLSAESQAKIFLEPYVGLSKFEQKLGSNGFVAKDIANGFHLGVRGGYQFGKTFFAGGEYFRGGPYKFNDQFNGQVQSENSTIFLGAIIGGDFDIIRISASYFPDHDLTDSDSSSKLTGSAFRVGFGLKVGKKIRANLDIFIQNLDKQVSAGGVESDQDPKIQGETAAVSVSFPFDFSF